MNSKGLLLWLLGYLLVSGEAIAAQGVAKGRSGLQQGRKRQDAGDAGDAGSLSAASSEAHGSDDMDLSVTGACAVDIVHHCAHILKVCVHRNHQR